MHRTALTVRACGMIEVLCIVGAMCWVSRVSMVRVEMEMMVVFARPFTSILLSAVTVCIVRAGGGSGER